MNHLIVGLFSSPEQAARAVQELSSIGVRGDQVATIAGTPAERAHEVGSGDPAAPDVGTIVVASLREAGMPAEQIGSYVETVRNGGMVVMVTPGDLPAANIKAIMLSYGSLNIGTNATQINSLGQQPHLEPGASQPGLGEHNPDATGLDPHMSVTGEPPASGTVERPTDGYRTQEHEPHQGLWKQSSKAGTVTGAVTGAATGAAAGSPGGPVGAAIGAAAGAVLGAGIGAVGDASGEQAEQEDRARGQDDRHPGTRKI